MKYAVGIDLGGTFVKAALVSESGELLHKSKLPIGFSAKQQTILKTITQIIQETIDKATASNLKVQGIGIGTPGIIYEGVVLGGSENLDGWENLDLATYFSQAFNLPVKVDNDANLMGLGEFYYGAAKGCTDVVFLTIGTGIGGAIIINGALYGGYKNRGAELGHVVVEHSGPDCNCGGKGCLELYSSTTALIKQYSEKSGMAIDDLSGHYIIGKYHEKEPNAVFCLEEHTKYLGHGISSFINTFAPEKVVIGGGISDAGQFYIDLIKKTAFKYMMPDCGNHTEIVKATLGNDAGSLGAATLILK
ncbi:MAG: ROK family protein [Flavobacteriaceae bacterium]|nr:ROK family protein [Flavobacteriaceae bacterium]